MLGVHVPRLHVSVPEVMVDRLRRQTSRTSEVDGIIKPDRTCERYRLRQWGIAGGGRNNTGHWLVNVESITTPQNRLGIAKRSPGKAHARLKIRIVLAIDSADVLPYAQQR